MLACRTVFREIRGWHHAVATPGDILFTSAPRVWICFERAAQIMSQLGDAVSVADEVATCSVSSTGRKTPWRKPRPKPPCVRGGSYVIVQ
jgi:hypothetical protein